MVLNELELCYLRQLVDERIPYLERAYAKNMRIFGDTDDVVLKQRKIGTLEVELEIMGSVKNKINIDIARLDFSLSE